MRKGKKKFYEGNNLYTVKQFVEKHPFLTESSLRWQMHRKNSIGLQDAFIKVFSKRVLVDEREYFRVMIEAQRKGTILEPCEK